MTISEGFLMHGSHALNLAAPKAVSEAFSGVVFKSMISHYKMQDASGISLTRPRKNVTNMEDI